MIAARQSHLARHQAFEVAEALKKKHPTLEIDFHFRESLGDKHLHDPLWKMPERGVFTEDFVDGLIQGEFDLVVHSWKDLPVDSRDGLALIACLPRADQRDLLLVKKESLQKDFSNQKLTIYSSSPRRILNLTQLLPQLWPQKISELDFQSVRGNIPTRIRKMLEAPEVDGLVLAKAALDRLMSPRVGEEWQELRTLLASYVARCEWMVLPLLENPTAAAQGAIVIEARQDRSDLQDLFAGVHCQATFEAVQRERRTLKEFGGGCHLALGISVITKNSTSILCIKGQTPEGKALSELHYAYSGPKFALETLHVVREPDLERSAISVDLDKLSAALGLFISRFDAWPKEYQVLPAQILWTAGLSTWKKLAAHGLWVHGTCESLGYSIPALEFLGTETSSGSPTGERDFLRLTHQAAVRTSTDVATYQIVGDSEVTLSDEYQFYYWRSGKVAEKYFAKYPWLKEKFHGCGFGDTGETLARLLAESPERLFFFLNSDEFYRTAKK
jgi:hydroxymethylbilane synthase